jgi:hypothetical protein
MGGHRENAEKVKNTFSENGKSWQTFSDEFSMTRHPIGKPRPPSDSPRPGPSNGGFISLFCWVVAEKIALKNIF